MPQNPHPEFGCQLWVQWVVFGSISMRAALEQMLPQSSLRMDLVSWLPSPNNFPPTKLFRLHHFLKTSVPEQSLELLAYAGIPEQLLTGPCHPYCMKAYHPMRLY